MAYIYKITNDVNGKIYIGNSEYDIISVIAYISEERQRVYVMARGRES